MTRFALLFAALTVAFAAPSAVSAQSLGDAVRATQARARAQAQQPPAAPSEFQRQPEPVRRPEIVREVSLGSVISNIQRRTPGKMLDAGKSYSGGRTILNVRWATDDGRRIDYRIDAETGAILSGG